MTTASVNPTPNFALMNRVLEQIEAHPETWTQDMWRCDTGMCFAGWAAEFAGGEWAVPADDYGAYVLIATPDDPPEDLLTEHGLTLPKYVSAALRATRVLGLHQDEANLLFRGGNTLADLRRIVADLRVDHGVTT